MVELDITKRPEDDGNNDYDDRPTLGMCLVLGAIFVITIACLITIYLVK
jgi:hypothetical protein